MSYFKHILMTICLLVITAGSLNAFRHHVGEEDWYTPVSGESSVVRKIEAISSYPGNEAGKFKDDILLTLDDGSQWKTHPSKQNTVSQWQVGDSVRVYTRGDGYFFKRDHHFVLVNDQTKGSSHVMFIKEASIPLTIVKIDEYVATFDKYGEIRERKLTLSNGSQWTIRNKLRFFPLNSKVCLSYFRPRGLNKDDPGVIHELFIPNQFYNGYPVYTITRPSF